VVRVVAAAKIIMVYVVTPNTSANHINYEGVCKSLSRLQFIHATSMRFLSTTPWSFGGINKKWFWSFCTKAAWSPESFNIMNKK
jgi:hypothetical protein